MKKVSLGPKKKKFSSLKALADEYGLPYMVLYMRIRNGYTPAQAVAMPYEPRA